MRAFTVQGTLRGLPLTAEAVALVYNPRVIPRAPATWAELERVAAAEVQAGRLGLALDLTSAYTQAGVFQAYGASPFGPKGTSDLGLAAPGAVQAGTFLRELGKISGMVSGLNDRAALVAFGDGRLAMWVTGPWNLGRLQQTGRDVRSAPLPPLPGAAGPWQPFVGRQGVMVAARRPHQKEALALARALTTETSQVTLYRAGDARRPVQPPAPRWRRKSRPWAALTRPSGPACLFLPFPKWPRSGGPGIRPCAACRLRRPRACAPSWMRPCGRSARR
ncbi:sugar ABC transporter substrate-binding protein [Deinococcus multiflagellatus]|uniref:Extracellular solute-binding protein n=1 Tax=Deinococcus multiflagellatus TaxID=1656887 RepID=A0ABW1ZDY0_9DEIO